MGAPTAGERGARERDPVAVLGVRLAMHCAPPQTIRNTVYLIYSSHPGSLPSPPHPSSGHWGWLNLDFLFGFIVVKV